MSLQTDLLTAIQAVLNQHGVQGGTIADPSLLDNPLTAPLGPNGEWQPSWLKWLADAATAAYPGGVAVGTDLGWDGNPTVKEIAWPSHVLYGGCLTRTDLTPHQRETLLWADQQGFGVGMAGAGGELPAWQPWFTVKRGPYTTMVSGQVYADLDHLRRQVERYYALYVGIGA